MDKKELAACREIFSMLKPRESMKITQNLLNNNIDVIETIEFGTREQGWLDYKSPSHFLNILKHLTENISIQITLKKD